MKKQEIKISGIDDFIAGYPPKTQKLLEQIRLTIRKAAPGATEAISYAIPTFKLEGNLVHFSGYKNHIGFYPTSSGIAAFRDELSAYELSKGTVRFPIDKPLPLDLITRIVKFRVIENLDRAASKSKPVKAKKS